MITLYSYWRSTAAYRVRIGLNLKGLDYRIQPVHLVRDGGQQHGDDYAKVNPQGLVPALDYNGSLYTQSLAILELLEEKHSEPPLLPAYPTLRAKARQMAHLIACDIHPLNNLRVLKYLKEELQVDEEAKLAWYRHWVTQGFAALETLLDATDVDIPYAVTDEPGLADICIVAQLYNARRFEIDLTPYPRMVEIEQRCLPLDAFERARPENQPDAE
jgi:maleylacetoacetate isomerase